MNWKYRQLLICLAITGIACVITLAKYPSLPDIVPVHWGIDGKPDGFQPKQYGVWLSIYFMLGISALMAIIPVLSPKAKSIEPFKETYSNLTYFIVGFMGVIQLVTLFASSSKLNMSLIIGLLVVIMLGVLGNWMSRIRPNYFMGIRTPWTLESPEVWDRTHRLAGRTMVGGAALGAILILAFQQIGPAIIIAVAGTIYPAIASYFIYKNLPESKNPIA